MASSGYIKLDRGILESELWKEKPFDRARAWVDLLLLASWKDHDEIYRGQVLHRKRGDVSCSVSWLAERWGWSRGKVYRYLGLLTETGMVTVNRTPSGTPNGTPNGTTLTIEKYAFYQDGRNTRRTTNGTTDETTDGTTDGTHHKKGKEGKRIANNARAREGEGNPYLKLLQNMEEEQ